MIIGQKASCWALGRNPAKIHPKYDSICQLHSPSHTSPFSTTTSSYALGIESIRNGKLSSAKERQRAERNQLIKSLKESPGKRDARNFLKHFDTPKKTEPILTPRLERAVSDRIKQAHHNEWRLNKTGVNLGNLYEPTKAIQESPVFAHEPLTDQRSTENVEPLHIALVKLRQPQILDDQTLGGIALTLSQMVRLGLNIAVVVDCDEDVTPDTLELTPTWEETVREQAARIVDALEEFNEPGAFEVDQSLSYSEVDTEIPSTVQIRGCVEVKTNQLLFPPIEDGIIPVIPPIAYDGELKKVRVRPDEVILALTREFTGINSQSIKENGPDEADDVLEEKSRSIVDRRLLDRIIILDPLGGIPSEHRIDGAHVFINLEAEYKDVKKELQGYSSRTPSDGPKEVYSVLGNGNPFSKFAESELPPLQNSPTPGLGSKPISDRHTKNLDIVQQALKLLPPSSSALIITPTEAAISSQAPFLPEPSTGVRTRRSKNPLIHNLLTDKPMISSSLPAPLVTRPLSCTEAEPNPATFLKKGIPVTHIPDTRIVGPWKPPSPSNPSIELESDQRIDFPRLVDLIEDSFRRKLDARHYLDRIRGRVAGIIIAGNYEGGAICTWELPTNPKTTPNPAPDSPLWVPYLDKFAVLTSSQGSGGVADIVWGALTRNCFPDGLVWRSRTSNPVNKWYFERAVGMWDLPGGEWTMFWTTEGIAEEWAKKKKEIEGGEMSEKGDLTRWESYVRVCRGVVPSWADGKRPD
ncbi:N-acetylglutamate synthase [Zopfia rhizophila CBS 207.26]|uniref:Amino-acid acetyltransferase, mitochondrial n=1 Tax=Zopfia rhizophila CBS 207.26 TaxID=1314779 RepID=A0A6A6EEQ3_9PEZI|nr:N-acetylglutamate synthase [Zopfia rhizophila CBS 207.26]